MGSVGQPSPDTTPSMEIGAALSYEDELIRHGEDPTQSALADLAMQHGEVMRVLDRLADHSGNRIVFLAGVGAVWATIRRSTADDEIQKLTGLRAPDQTATTESID